jgi:hypothetical protein
MTARKRSVAWVIAPIVIIVVLVSAYVAGYFWLPENDSVYWVEDSNKTTRRPVPGDELAGIERNYGYDWISAIYKPAGWAEADCDELRLL